MSQADAVNANVTLPPNPERATLEGRNKIVGFWLFLGAEMVLFGTLFATFIALRGGTANGPTEQELYNLGFVAVMTAVLLTSSLMSVFAVQAMHKGNVKGVQLWLGLTILLALTFLGLEIYEFTHYVKDMNHGFTTSAYASSFYALVGFHGAHVVFGIGWLTTVALQLSKKGLTTVTAPKVYVSSLYWHFIDVVWVFIFTLVYLMGKVG